MDRDKHDGSRTGNGRMPAGGSIPRLNGGAGNIEDFPSPAASGIELPAGTAMEFSFENQKVRTIVKDGEIWFVAADVCAVLEHTDPSKAVSRLDADERGTTNVRTLGGPQQLIVVTESGLYVLIMTSRKPQAKAFRRWVTHEVLPAIRTTGRYEAQAAQTPPAAQRSGPVHLALPGPGRYVVTVGPHGGTHIHHTSYDALEPAATTTDCRILAHAIKIICGFWDMTQHMRAVGLEPTGSYAAEKLEAAILEGGRLATHCLGCYDQPGD